MEANHQDETQDVMRPTNHFTQFSAEIIIHSNLQHESYARHITTKPEEADFFFVPYYAALVGIMNSSGVIHSDAEVSRIVSSSPWYKRKGGADFVFVLSFPPVYGLGYEANSSKATREQLRLLMEPSIVLTVEKTRVEVLRHYHTGIAIPYPILHPVLLNASSAGDLDQFSKPYLMYFEGRSLVSQNNKGNGHKIRPLLKEEMETWNNKSAGIKRTHHNTQLALFVDAKDQYGPAASIEEIYDNMRRSVFCACPAGDTSTSKRLFDTIQLGECIPVLMSDEIVLPFESHVDYSEAAVVVQQPDFFLQERGRLMMALEDLNTAEVAVLKRNMRGIRQKVLLTTPPRKGDAFEQIMYELQMVKEDRPAKQTPLSQLTKKKSSQTLLQLGTGSGDVPPTEVNNLINVGSKRSESKQAVLMPSL